MFVTSNTLPADNNNSSDSTNSNWVKMRFDDLHSPPRICMDDKTNRAAQPRRLESPRLSTYNKFLIDEIPSLFSDPLVHNSMLKPKHENVDSNIATSMVTRVEQDLQLLQHTKLMEQSITKEVELSKEFSVLRDLKSREELVAAHRVEIDKQKEAYELRLKAQSEEWECKLRETVEIMKNESALRLSSVEKSHEVQLLEKNHAIDLLTIKLKDTEKKSNGLENLLREKERVNSQRLIEIKAKHENIFEGMERSWQQKLETLVAEHNQILFAIQNKHAIDNSTKEITLSAQCEAIEERLKADYAKKVKRLEKKVTEAARAFALRLQYTEGVLNEARRDAGVQQAHLTTQIQLLREELEIKDRRLTRMQVYIDSANSLRDAIISWKEEAVSVCESVINSSSTISEIPKLDEREIVDKMLSKDGSSLDSTTVNIRLRQQEYKRENVAINRKQITKVYQLCQKVMQKAEHYVVPGIDRK